MKSLILFFLSALCSSQVVVQPTVIRGHRMGESVLEFFRVEDAASRLDQCAKLLQRSDIQKQIDRSILMRADFDQCMNIGSVLRTGSGKIGFGELNKAESPVGAVEFADSRLVKMDLDFWNLVSHKYDFATVLHDFTNKFSEPDRQWSENFQNGFGALFTYRRASWAKSDASITLTELQSDSVSALIEDPSFAKKSAIDEAAKHKSVLDR